jgi:integrase/recombinase XerD
MTQPKKQISPFRQRMIDEMNMRKLNPRTQISYLRAVDKFAKYLKHSPEHATSAQFATGTNTPATPLARFS